MSTADRPGFKDPTEPICDHDSQGRVIQIICPPIRSFGSSCTTATYDDCQPPAMTSLPFSSAGQIYTHVTLSAPDGRLLAECLPAEGAITESDLDLKEWHLSLDGRPHSVRCEIRPEEWPAAVVARWFRGGDLLQVQLVFV